MPLSEDQLEQLRVFLEHRPAHYQAILELQAEYQDLQAQREALESDLQRFIEERKAFPVIKAGLEVALEGMEKERDLYRAAFLKGGSR
jgi:hypothetical protein